MGQGKLKLVATHTDGFGKLRVHVLDECPQSGDSGVGLGREFLLIGVEMEEAAFVVSV